jgi:hypothetical protein
MDDREQARSEVWGAAVLLRRLYRAEWSTVGVQETNLDILADVGLIILDLDARKAFPAWTPGQLRDRIRGQWSLPGDIDPQFFADLILNLQAEARGEYKW